MLLGGNVILEHKPGLVGDFAAFQHANAGEARHQIGLAPEFDFSIKRHVSNCDTMRQRVNMVHGSLRSCQRVKPVINSAFTMAPRRKAINIE